MGVHLGQPFPNALPLTEARKDPRRSLLYRTIVRSPLVAPEALGQYAPGGFWRGDDGQISTVARQPQKVLTRPTITASQAFPWNYSAPGGGIRIETPRARIEVGQESTEARIRRWLEEESVFAGIKNKWLAIAGAILVWKKL